MPLELYDPISHVPRHSPHPLPVRCPGRPSWCAWSRNRVRKLERIECTSCERAIWVSAEITAVVVLKQRDCCDGTPLSRVGPSGRLAVPSLHLGNNNRRILERGPVQA